MGVLVNVWTVITQTLKKKVKIQQTKPAAGWPLAWSQSGQHVGSWLVGPADKAVLSGKRKSCPAAD